MVGRDILARVQCYWQYTCMAKEAVDIDQTVFIDIPGSAGGSKDSCNEVHGIHEKQSVKICTEIV